MMLLEQTHKSHSLGIKTLSTLSQLHVTFMPSYSSLVFKERAESFFGLKDFTEALRKMLYSVTCHMILTKK